MLLSFFLLPYLLSSLEIPLAPYNIKVFCRQGLRFTPASQTAQQCPSSATACGYIEINKVGVESTGIFDCVESGMLKNDEDAIAEDINQLPANLLFSQLCGAQASCSSLTMDQLNPAFYRYLITHHEVKLEELKDGEIKFCCSLFHATLQKLIVSGTDRLPSASATSMHCGGEECFPGAVGCLYHSMSSSTSEEYEDRLIRTRRDKDEDYDYQINAVEISFDDEESSLILVTREPPQPPSLLLNRSSQFLPSLRLPIVPPPPTKTKNGVKYALINEDEDEVEEEETLCVYRHLNDELYRWCLFVHQSKNGDRCYFHQGHTVCCCFAPPDKETCDPSEMELVIPGKQGKLPPIKMTPRPFVETTTRRLSTTTTTEEPTTSTTTTTTTTTSKSLIITTTMAPTTSRRCHITYTKAKGRQTPVLVCSKASKWSPLLLLLVFLFL